MTDTILTKKNTELLLGAVAYDKKVVDVWEGIRSYFRDNGFDLEVALFLSYEGQVQALLEGRIDVAWNTNLAHVQVEAATGGATTPLAMRDVDVGWTTHLLALRGGPVQSLDDLRGKTLALGSRDSGHAAILPVHFLAQHGLVEGRDYQSLRFDLDVGKHGDTGTSEKDVLQAVLDGRADAGAVGSPFWKGIQAGGLNPDDAVRSVWQSPAYNHCMFDARPGLDAGLAKRFADLLLAMDETDPVHRRILDDEGIERCWIAPDTTGYDSLRDAATEQGFLPEAPRVPA